MLLTCVDPSNRKMEKTMRTMAITALACTSIALAGCAGFDDRSVKRTGVGAGVGAGAGAIIGAMSGNFGKGAAIGAVVGGAGGYLYDQISKDQGGS